MLGLRAVEPLGGGVRDLNGEGELAGGRGIYWHVAGVEGCGVVLDGLARVGEVTLDNGVVL